MRSESKKFDYPQVTQDGTDESLVVDIFDQEQIVDQQKLQIIKQ